MNGRICLSQSDKKIGGVCGGIAGYFGLESSILRILVVLCALLFHIIPILIIYVILWLALPKGC